MKTLLRLVTAFFVGLTAGCATQTPAPVRHPMAAGHMPATRPTPLLLISLDGFRADYLRRGLSPTLQMLADGGVRARAMKPSFPSLTFPNHYTLVTGKYPDDNGIVNNDMFDPKLGSFRLNLSKAVDDGRWWDEAEPIWVDADRHGLRTATMFWPGSEAKIHGYRPDHWYRYNGAMPYDQRVDQILRWLDLPPTQRPQFMTLYFQRVDTAGHYYGPDSPETDQAIRDADAALARLVAGLKKRGLFEHINLIVLADHGMAYIAPDHRIYLDELINTAHARVVSTGAIAGLIPAPGHTRELDTALLTPHPHMTCWKKSQIPARLHYGHNPRVPPLVCAAKVGWLIVSSRSSLQHNKKPLLGEHGFDNAAPQMRALFLAHGPSFRKHLVVPEFPNVDVYPLMTHLLGIPPQPNDGHFSAVKDMLRPVDR